MSLQLPGPVQKRLQACTSCPLSLSLSDDAGLANNLCVLEHFQNARHWRSFEELDLFAMWDASGFEIPHIMLEGRGGKEVSLNKGRI